MAHARGFLLGECRLHRGHGWAPRPRPQAAQRAVALAATLRKGHDRHAGSWLVAIVSDGRRVSSHELQPDAGRHLNNVSTRTTADGMQLPLEPAIRRDHVRTWLQPRPGDHRARQQHCDLRLNAR